MHISFFVFLFVFVLQQVLMALFYADFRKLSWIVRFILHHPVD